MNIEEYREFCLTKKGVTEEFPFDENTLVFKVMGKVFSLCGVENFESINLKCDPEKAIVLRENYDYVRPGFHMNKKHWNTVDMDWRAEDDLIKSWIDHSYDLVAASLTKKLKETLKSL